MLPGSWNTMVTMSLPMWRFRRSWRLGGAACERGFPSACSFKRGRIWAPVSPTGPPVQGWDVWLWGVTLAGREAGGRQSSGQGPAHAAPLPGSPEPPSHLLLIIGGVWQHRGYVEHDLMVLVRRVEGVRARGIRCGRGVGDTEGKQGESGWLGPVVPAHRLQPLSPHSQQVENSFPPPAKPRAMSSKGLSLVCSPSPPPAPNLYPLRPQDPAWSWDAEIE